MPGKPPSDAIVLFDGKDFSAWNGAETWKIENGDAVVGRNYIETKDRFGDCQLHVEWSAPTPPSGESQGRGNSGVFFGSYELQVLDSYDNETYYDGQAAAIYKQKPPMVNAMRPPGEWNVYDIIWTAPRFKEDGKLESPAYITVLHNGVAVQNHFALLGDTPFHRPPQYNPPSEQPIRLQDHGNPVKFRNIWVRPLKPIEGRKTREPYMRIGDKEIPLAKTNVRVNVTLDGHKLPTGKVTFIADGDAEGRIGYLQDGAFTMEGLPPGEYAVLIEPDLPGSGSAIPAKYAAKDQSGITLAVQSGANEFNIDLNSR
jgi:hypothetical protein